MRPLYLSLIAILSCAILPAQTQSLDEFFERTSKQCMTCPLEKVYLHTDRSVYVAGDSIWMRAHVVDGICHAPKQSSAYVYVTLQNPFLKTISQVRLKMDQQGHIYGYIALPDNLPKGEYSLCAYTQYMRNFDSEYFFKKRITVNNVLNKSIRLETYNRGNHLDVRFINPMTGETQDVQNCTAQVSDDNIAIHRQDSGYSIKFHNSKNKVVLIEAGNYKEFVNVDLKPDYDVSFFPEGGQLVAGEFNRLAFKSINCLGLGEDITGTLRDERDSILLRFHSLYRGMGSMTFIPELGKKYIAVCENATGMQKRFELPQATDGYTLWVNEVNGKIYAKVLSSPHGKHDEEMYVYALQRGWPVAIRKWQKKTLGLVCNKDEFIEGTVSFILANENGQIVSERLLFIHKDEQVQGKLHTDNTHPGKREKVKLTIEVPEADWEGDCSISVVDNKDIRPDNYENILSSLLLTSDLRGHIEAPAWYFEKDENDTLKLRRQALDALMMTQGWRKYNLEKVWKNEFKSPDFLPEQFMKISGKVTSNVARKPIVNGKVQLMVPNMAISEQIWTDSNGRFSFDNIEAPDSTIYWVSALTNKGKDKVTLQLDTIIYPVLENPLPPYHTMDYSKQMNTSDEYLEKVDLRLLNNQGIRHYFIDEVIVTAPKIEPRTEYETKEGNVLSIKEKSIEESGTQDIVTFLKQKIPAFSFIEIINQETRETYTTIALRGEEATLFIDGVIYRKGEQLIIKNLHKNDIEQVDVLKSPFSLIYDPMTKGGVIAITTKRGHNKYNAKWGPTNLKKTMPLGSQKPTKFYVPRYELTAEKESKNPDLRTTIHWQPHLKVHNGKAYVEFYTADGTVDYSVIIEGVGKDGRLLRIEENIK